MSYMDKSLSLYISIQTNTTDYDLNLMIVLEQLNTLHISKYRMVFPDGIIKRTFSNGRISVTNQSNDSCSN